jgi:hypothetical protein
MGPKLLGSFAFLQCRMHALKQRQHADNVSAVAGPRFSG